MHLVWKGKLRELSQIGESELPDNAVKFNEPQDVNALRRKTYVFLLPVLALVIAAFFVKGALRSSFSFLSIASVYGIFLSFLTILPHELLHAVCFPKDAEVQLWFWPRNLMAFVYSAVPVAKSRFIFLSLLPSLVFGLLPLLLWALLPIDGAVADLLLSFAFCSLTFGVGDFLNVFNAATQMPYGSLTQLSGFHSYWFFPPERDATPS